MRLTLCRYDACDSRGEILRRVPGCRSDKEQLFQDLATLHRAQVRRGRPRKTDMETLLMGLADIPIDHTGDLGAGRELANSVNSQFAVAALKPVGADFEVSRSALIAGGAVMSGPVQHRDLRLLTVAQVAQVLQVSDKTVQRPADRVMPAQVGASARVLVVDLAPKTVLSLRRDLKVVIRAKSSEGTGAGWRI